MRTRRTVAVLFGGRSGEHEVSLRSAASVVEALRPNHDVVCVRIGKDGGWRLLEGPEPSPVGGVPVFLAPSPDDGGRLRRLADAVELARPDVVFPVLHGTYGEDGTVQGLLELAGVPYVGAGVAASAVSMDKEMMKALFARAGLAQVEYVVLRRRDAAAEADLPARLGLPLFVKPVNLGSSVGVRKVQRVEELGAAIEFAFRFDRKVIVERGVEAREIEVAVLGNDDPVASVPGEIVPDREFYDYDSKYDPASRTELRIPAPVPPALADELRRAAVVAFRAVDGAGCARVDFFLERSSGRVLVNEINTLPGFTSISMYPKLWAASGVPYPELVSRLVELALERHAQRARLQTDYGARQAGRASAPPGDVRG